MDWGYVILIMLVSGVGTHMMLGVYKRLMQKDSPLVSYLTQKMNDAPPTKPARPESSPLRTVKEGGEPWLWRTVGSVFARLGRTIGWLCSRLMRRIHDDTLKTALAEWPAKARKRAAAMQAVMTSKPRPNPYFTPVEKPKPLPTPVYETIDL